MSAQEVVPVSGLTNREFLERYARPGRIGLSGGDTWIDRAICRAERHLDAARNRGQWSHAFLFEGERVDGHHWVIESDLQFHRKHIQLGVQENRVAKYADEGFYSSLAVLDFGLTPAQVRQLLAEALGLVADRARYSVRELLGTFIALRRPGLRPQANLLARKSCWYCSAFVRHVFQAAGLELTPGIDLKNTTPEDLARTPLPHTTWLLQREAAPRGLGKLKARLRGRVRAGLTGRRGPHEDRGDDGARG